LSKVTYDAFLIGWMFQPEVEARISRFVTTGMLRFRGRKADAERKSFMRASPGAPMQETDLWPQEFVSRELALQLTAGAVLGGLLAMEVGGRAEWTGNTTNTEPNWSGQADFWEMMVLLRVRLVDGWE
jgi:hypothetical protein